MSLIRTAFAAGLSLAVAASMAAAPSDAAPWSKRRAPAVKALPYGATAEALRDQALQGSIAYSLVEDITTRFGARPAGSDAERRAAEWGAGKLKALGFANVSIETFPLVPWTRISESGSIVGPNPQTLVVSLLGGSMSTPAEGIEADAVVFDTFQELQDAPAGSLAGKIAVVVQPTVRMQDGSGYGYANAMRGQGPSVAASKGAVAYVMRALGTQEHRFANTGATKRTPDAVPGFAVSPPDAAADPAPCRGSAPAAAAPQRTGRGPGQRRVAQRHRRGSRPRAPRGGHRHRGSPGQLGRRHGAIDDAVRRGHHHGGGQAHQRPAGEAATHHPRGLVRLRRARANPTPLRDCRAGATTPNGARTSSAPTSSPAKATSAPAGSTA